MCGVTEANGVKQEKIRKGRTSNRKWWIWPSCSPRQEVSGTTADIKLAWMSSRRAECYLWQQQESLTHHQVETRLQQAAAELTGGKEFRGFWWLEPTPLITLVLSNTVSTLAVCVCDAVVMSNSLSWFVNVCVHALMRVCALILTCTSQLVRLAQCTRLRLVKYAQSPLALSTSGEPITSGQV